MNPSVILIVGLAIGLALFAYLMYDIYRTFKD